VSNAAQDQIGSAVVVQVADFHRHVSILGSLQTMSEKTARGDLLQPDQRIVLAATGPAQNPIRQKGAGHHIQVFVSVQIDRQGAHHARHGRQHMVLERKTPLVLQPVNGVAGLDVESVQRVAAGVQHIGVAVGVQIDKLDAAGAEGRIFRRKDQLPLEQPLAAVQEGFHRLEFLTEQGDEIQAAIAIQVDDRCMDDAVPVIEQALAKPGR